MKKLFLLMILAISFATFSCSKNDDEDDGPYEVPTLDMEFSVTGAISMDVEFISPENNNGLGNHSHAVLSIFSSNTGTMVISGLGTYDDGSNYSWTLGFTSGEITEGTYDVIQSTFTNGQYGFPETVGGSIEITNAEFGMKLPVGEFHQISGNFNIQLENQTTPAESITFSGSFTGLHVTAE